ncbi:MAG: HpcH/HpaI aldolase/citrate lyase family protein [Halanaeroarchaeum sp.]
MNARLKDSFESNSHPLGTWVSVGHPTVAEISASVGMDFILVDLEHTAMTLETVESLVRAVEAAEGDTEILVRVPWNDHVRIKRILDIDVDGIMVPMLESAAETEELVAATRYPPEGRRGIASGRAAEYGQSFEEYVASANSDIVTIGQIETQEGVENAEGIAAVDGLDALFVGPADLSAAYGVFAQWDSETLTEAMGAIIDAADRADTPIGTLTVDPDDMEMRLEQGFDYLIAGKDTSYLSAANRETKARYERLIEQREENIETN